MAYVFPYFVIPCLEAFSFLQTRFAFSAPTVKQVGRECYICYQKNDRWVSIAYEPGSVPIVELFHPSHDIKHRRIPRLQSGLTKPRHFADTDASQQRLTLQAQAASLETTERDFLSET
jgi:hypothetical protein